MAFYSADPVAMVGVSATTATNGGNNPEVGAILRNGDEKYMWIYNAGNSAIAPGYAVTLSGVTGYSVTVSTVTNIDIAIGVVKHATIATGYYGFIMQRGFSSVEKHADVSAATGEALTLGDGGVFVAKSTVTDHEGNVVGKVMESIASGGSGQAYVSF